MASKVVEFKVGMTCDGCKNAVNRILTRIPGVEKVDANVETKNVKVYVAESVESGILLEALQKWSASSKKPVELIS